MTWLLIDLAVRARQPISEVERMDDFTRGMLMRYLMKRGA